MKNILEISKLTKKYKDGSINVTALESISFKVPEGNDIAILGPSGSGKTTLLQLAGGLDRPTSGDVIVNGRNMNELSDTEISEFRNKTMGFVFQMINLHEFLTAKENVLVPMLLGGMNKRAAVERSQYLLDKFKLLDRANHLPKQLSGGEQQRVAVARALANNPKLIFADEPTGKLDRKNSEMIIEILDRLSKEEKMSVIMITHDEKVAKRFSRVIVLENGRVKLNSI